MAEKIKFTVAGFFTKKTIINKLLSLYEEYSYMFKKNIEINTLYDSFPDLRWNGGRVLGNSPIDLDQILLNIRHVNSLNIGINLTFSNTFITEDDLLDKNCNNILKILSKNSLNGVIISSNLLGEYIKKNYPTINVILSVTYFYHNIYNIEEKVIEIMKLEKYDKVVIPPDLNSDIEFLNKLHHKSHIEVLINETCYQNCIYKSQHYRLINMDNKNKTNHSRNYCQKQYLDIKNTYGLINNFSELSKYREIGIENFKISARSLSDKIFIYFLSEYLINDAYKQNFFDYMSEQPINNLNFIEIYKEHLVW